MRPSCVIESYDFVRGDTAWKGRSFSEWVTVLSGASAAGKSTPMEALLYALGLTDGTIMPEVKACDYVRLTFRVGGVRWSATRKGGSRSATVVFQNLSEEAEPVELRVKPEKASQESASDFALRLWGIPLLKGGGVPLHIDQVRSTFCARQENIATRYMNGLSPKERTFTLDVLFRLRDEELDRLESAFHRAEREHSEVRTTLNRFVNLRQSAGLESPEAVRGEQERKRKEHGEVIAQAHTAQAELTDLEVAQAGLDQQEQHAYGVYEAADQQLTGAREASEKAASALGAAEGYLKALLLRAHAFGHCPRCDQELPEREAGHCQVCDQEVAASTAGTDWDALVAAARESLEAAGKERERSRSRVQQASTKARTAWALLEQARKSSAAHWEKTAPVRARARELETRASALAGELLQLAKRLEDLEVIARLEKDLLECHRAMKEAERERDAARAERQERRTELATLWSQYLLARLKAILPNTNEVRIDPQDYSVTVDGKAFHDISVAGGPKTAVNVAALLSLQDLARSVPDILVPPLLIIDAPLTGFSSQGLDQDTSRRMMEQILGAADAAGTKGRTCRSSPPSTTASRASAAAWKKSPSAPRTGSSNTPPSVRNRPPDAGPPPGVSNIETRTRRFSRRLDRETADGGATEGSRVPGPALGDARGPRAGAEELSARSGANHGVQRPLLERLHQTGTDARTACTARAQTADRSRHAPACRGDLRMCRAGCPSAPPTRDRTPSRCPAEPTAHPDAPSRGNATTLGRSRAHHCLPGVRAATRGLQPGVGPCLAPHAPVATAWHPARPRPGPLPETGRPAAAGTTPPHWRRQCPLPPPKGLRRSGASLHAPPPARPHTPVPPAPQRNWSRSRCAARNHDGTRAPRTGRHRIVWAPSAPRTPTARETRGRGQPTRPRASRPQTAAVGPPHHAALCATPPPAEHSTPGRKTASVH